MDRRQALGGIAKLTAAAAAAAGASPALANEPSRAAAARDGAVSPLVARSPFEILRDAPPINLPRAYEIMERRGLDGLIVSDPVNVYHLTGYWPVSSRMSGGAAAHALLSRDPKQPIGVVAAQFTYYYLLSDTRYRYPHEFFLHSMPADRARAAAAKAAGFTSEAAAAPARDFTDLGREPVDALEKARRESVDAMLARRPLSADAEFAIVKAARALGLDRGKGGMLAVDSPDLERLVAGARLAARSVSADEPLKLIRLVKSPREIELMRIASVANREAALAAASAARAGATYRELRAVFFAEAARRGNRGVFMVIGGVSAEGVDRTLREGDAFLFDAVSEGAGYHGDFARTVFVGEPRRTMRQATDAIALGWSTVRDALKPGLRLSEITALGRETLRKAGHEFLVSFGPHSVGLYHSDAGGLGDIALEPGMIFSVDCPVMNVGIGGSAHLEDLTLITANGSEPIHPTGGSTIQV